MKKTVISMLAAALMLSMMVTGCDTAASSGGDVHGGDAALTLDDFQGTWRSGIFPECTSTYLDDSNKPNLALTTETVPAHFMELVFTDKGVTLNFYLADGTLAEEGEPYNPTYIDILAAPVDWQVEQLNDADLSDLAASDGVVLNYAKEQYLADIKFSGAKKFSALKRNINTDPDTFKDVVTFEPVTFTKQ